MARKFLYVVALLIVLAVIAMISFSFFGASLMQSVLTPRVAFSAPAPLPADFYQSAEGWFSRPDGRRGDAANWQPTGLDPLPPAEARDGAAIFFLHPTSAFSALKWNAQITDHAAAAQAQRFLRLQASALAPAGRTWAPRYRQAEFGAFLTDKPEAQRAIDLAYGDVRAAFETFLAANPDGPLLLAGHSQGTMHLLRLLAEQVGGTDWRGRVVAIYAVGWPISVRHDLPGLGFPGCAGPGESGCLLAWQSFGPPADTSTLDTAYARTKGLDGADRAGTPMLCINPLSGAPASTAPASANQGLLMGNGEAGSTQLMRPGHIGAQCDARGILLLDRAPNLGAFVMPGNNYHAYDYALFWANIRADALERLAGWHKSH